MATRQRGARGISESARGIAITSRDEIVFIFNCVVLGILAMAFIASI